MENDIWLDALPPPDDNNNIYSDLNIPGTDILPLVSIFMDLGLPEEDAIRLAETYKPVQNNEDVLKIIQRDAGFDTLKEAQDWQNQVLTQNDHMPKLDEENAMIFNDEVRELLGLPLNASDLKIGIELGRRGYGTWSVEAILEDLRRNKD